MEGHVVDGAFLQGADNRVESDEVSQTKPAQHDEPSNAPTAPLAEKTTETIDGVPAVAINVERDPTQDPFLTAVVEPLSGPTPAIHAEQDLTQESTSILQPVAATDLTISNHIENVVGISAPAQAQQLSDALAEDATMTGTPDAGHMSVAGESLQPQTTPLNSFPGVPAVSMVEISAADSSESSTTKTIVPVEPATQQATTESTSGEPQEKAVTPPTSGNSSPRGNLPIFENPGAFAAALKEHAAPTSQFDEESSSQPPTAEIQAPSNAPVPSGASQISLPSGLDVDSNWDTDSAMGSEDARSSTASLRSSIYHYIAENGRTYHRFKEGNYVLPNDETEQDRLDLQHHIFVLTLDGNLHIAPLHELQGGLHNVLDMGTGTGIWAIDFANAYPSAAVVGSDLSPIQPEFVPPNCHFEVDDVEDTWLYNHKFDYIHGRMLAFCFKSHEVVFRSAYENLRPGGFLELQDGVMPLRCVDQSGVGTAFEKWVQLMMSGAQQLGRDLGRVPRYKQILEDCGFVDVVEKHYAWPIGSWPKGERMKTLGAWAKEDYLTGLQGLSMAVMTRGLGMTSQEVELLLMEVRENVNSRRLHAFIPIVMVYGRKPYDNE